MKLQAVFLSALLTCSLLFCPLSNADVFRCINHAGKTIYKDEECDVKERLDEKVDLEKLTKKISVLKPSIDESSPLGKNLLLNNSFENKLIDWKIPLGALWTSDGGKMNTGGLIIHAANTRKLLNKN